MCRLLGYLGSVVKLTELLIEPKHSLVEQSYQPQEMTAGLLNADGFGFACYHPARNTPPLIYRSILPIWNDVNLIPLSQFISSDCVLASVRSATPGLAVDVSNSPPYNFGDWLLVHNGFIEQFRYTLHRSLVNSLTDPIYQQIKGSTDSEYIFALLYQFLGQFPQDELLALRSTIECITKLSRGQNISSALNLIFTNGTRLYACRYSTHPPAPSLYYTQQGSSIYIVSEPMEFPHFSRAEWQQFPENTYLKAESATIELGQIL
ncbi:MAG: ergothioneine biosynthesis protein EgtC [Pseudanabaenaceae cyanobacterium]